MQRPRSTPCAIISPSRSRTVRGSASSIRAISSRDRLENRIADRPPKAADKAEDFNLGNKKEKAEEETNKLSYCPSIGLLAVALLGTPPADFAAAQAITKSVTIVVPYSAGGGTGTVAGLIGDQMSRSLGQPVLIENVVGAGGTRANERVARS